MFFEGTIVVRNLQDCEGLLYTNMVGAKADFSFDGRYIAFHEQGGTDGESQIRVVDLERRVAIPVTDLRGSCLFPSWTTDGRLFFLCVSDEYRGFVLADQFLSNPAEPLPTDYRNDSWVEEVWINCFEASEPETAITIVLVCSFWSAHCPDALADLQRLSEEIASEGIDARCFAATVPEASDFRRTQALFKRYAPDVQQLELRARGATLTGAQNQIPSTLVFRGNALEERHLGELDYESLRRWAEGRGGER